MTGWQWHQLDHVQKIICTSLQTDNYASTASLNIYRPDVLRDIVGWASAWSFDNRVERTAVHSTGRQTALYNRFDNRLYTRYSRLSNLLSNRLDNRFDNRLYRVNGASGSVDSCELTWTNKSSRQTVRRCVLQFVEISMSVRASTVKQCHRTRPK